MFRKPHRSSTLVRVGRSQFLPQTEGVGSKSRNPYVSISVLYVILFARGNGKEFGNEGLAVIFFIVIFNK
jgi:hypothetical protein